MASLSTKQVLAITCSFLAAMTSSNAQLRHGGRVRRSDDSTFASLEKLVEQQAAVIQSLQSAVTALETRLAAIETRLTEQVQEMTSLKSRIAVTSRTGWLHDASFRRQS